MNDKKFRKGLIITKVAKTIYKNTSPIREQINIVMNFNTKNTRDFVSVLAVMPVSIMRVDKTNVVSKDYLDKEKCSDIDAVITKDIILNPNEKLVIRNLPRSMLSKNESPTKYKPVHVIADITINENVN